MSSCLICNNCMSPFISFGTMPIANGFLAEDQFNNEYFFKMETVVTQAPLGDLLILSPRLYRELRVAEGIIFLKL